MLLKEVRKIAPGHVHRRFLNLGWIIAFPLCFFTATYLNNQGYNFYFSFFLSIWNYWLCRISSPDLDHIAINLDEGEGMRFFEKIWFIGWILRALWLSYTTLYAGIMLAFGGHRSIMSHSLILGTGLRILFLNAPLYFILDYLYGIQLAYEKFNMARWIIPYFFSQFILWSLGDAIHLLLDTEIAKNILYKPETRGGENATNFKPKYGKLITMVLKVIFGYSYNKIEKIINLKR